MASYNELIALIDAFIKRNGVQAITGQILNGVLKAMVDQVGRGYAIMGVATPSTNPGTPDAPESWFASTPGTYTNFGGLEVADAEFALLSYTPSGEVWTKTTLTEGIQEVSASIDGNVGTPEVTAEYINGGLIFTFSNMKGQTGDAAGFGTVNATVDGNIGTPGVSVNTSGPDTAKNITFAFRNLKGETGVTSVVATVDNTTGTPSCSVSLVGQELHLDFHGLKGAQGDTGSSVDYPFTIVNNLTTDDPTQALSAAQGVVLQGELSQLEAKVDKFSASATGGATSILARIPLSLKAGERVRVKYTADASTFSVVIRIHNTDNTYQTLTSAASGSYENDVICTKDADYIEATKYDSSVSGHTITLSVVAGFRADYDDTEEQVTALNTEVKTLPCIVSPCSIQSTTWTNVYGHNHIVFPVSGGEKVDFEISGSDPVLYCAFLTQYSTPKNGDTPSFVSGYSGRQTKRISFLVPSGTKYFVVNDPADASNTITSLLINGIDVLGGLYVAMLDYANSVNNNTSNFSNTAEGTSNSIHCEIYDSFKQGDKLYVKYTADSDAFACIIRTHNTDGTNSVITNSATGQFVGEFTLEKDVDYVEAVRYGDANVNGKNITLYISSGLSHEVDKLKDSVSILPELESNVFQRSNSATGTSGNILCRITTDMAQGNPVYLKYTADSDAFSCTVRIHCKDNSYTVLASKAFGTFESNVILEKDADYAEAVRYGDTNVNGHNIGLLLAYGLGAEVNELKKEVLSIGNVPAYYHDGNYIDDKIRSINEKWMNCENGADIFSFFTDTHYYRSKSNIGVVLDYLIRNSNVKKVVFGGDVASINTGSDVLYDEVNEHNTIVSRITALCKYLPVHGNHDYYITYNDGGETVVVAYPYSAVTGSILNQCNIENIVLNEEDVAPYYYYDEHFSKLRYIVIDDFYRGDGYSGLNFRTGVAQMKFIANAVLSTPAGYDNVFIAHCNIADGTTVDSSEYTAGAELRSLVSAIQNNTTFSYDGVSYDFSSITNKVILFLSGHFHQDVQNYIDNTLYVGTASDSAGATNSPMSSYVSYPAIQANSINEGCFDTIVFDRGNKVLFMVRIGVGFDRIFNLERKDINIGDTLQLTSRFATVDTWGIHDSIGSVYDPSAEQKWTFTNNVATISESGLVTAISSGECYAFAISEDGEQEFFYIKVRP